MKVTLEILLRDQLHFSIVSWSGRRDDKQQRFQQAWFLGLIAASHEVIALHPDGDHGEWRVSPLDDQSRTCES